MKKTLPVAKLVRPDNRSPDTLVGCTIPISQRKLLLADVYQMAGELSRRGAEATVVNSFGGGDNIRLSAVGFSNVPCLFGRYWRGMASWTRKLLKYLEKSRMPHCTRISRSDEGTLKTLKIHM